MSLCSLGSSYQIDHQWAGIRRQRSVGNSSCLSSLMGICTDLMDVRHDICMRKWAWHGFSWSWSTWMLEDLHGMPFSSDLSARTVVILNCSDPAARLVRCQGLLARPAVRQNITKHLTGSNKWRLIFCQSLIEKSWEITVGRTSCQSERCVYGAHCLYGSIILSSCALH